MLFSVKQEKNNSIWKFLPLLLLVICIILFTHFSSQLSADNTARSRTALERAITRSITQCYALEGTYPPDLKYLVDHYGLIYDSDYYYIDYNYIGSNLRPDVTIIERN